MKSVSQSIRVITLVVTCLGFFMVLLDSSVVLVALPTMQADLHAQLSDLQWTVDAYTLSFAALMLTGGSLSDRFGRKRLFLIGLVLFLIGSAFCGFTPDFNWLIVGRVMQGIGAAALSPGSLSLLVSTFSEPRARAQAIGIWTGISGLAVAAGPLVGGLLIQVSNWRAIFFVNLPLGVLALALGLPLLIESRNPNAQRIDYPGQVLVVGGLTCLIMALIQSSSQGWTSPLILGLLIVAAMLLIAFLLVESRVREPMLPLQLFANIRFSIANLSAVFLGFVIIGAMFFLTQYLQSVQGEGALDTGVRLLPITVGMFIFSPMAGRLTHRLGPRPPIILGTVLAAVGLLLLMGLEPTTDYSMLWWRLAILGTGIGFIFAPLTVVVLSNTAAAHSGLGSSILNTSRQVGVTLGTAVLGAFVVQRFGDNIVSQLVQRGVPKSTSASIASKIASAGAQAARSAALKKLQLPLSPAELHQAINQAFVDSLHGAFLIAAICMLVTAVLVGLLIRQQPAPAKSKQAAGVPATPRAEALATPELD
ncbi:MFS transporter [Dictyobacter sp. S3.2.2.5]|uniref:MFS transporter n=1 Tax=Dictyobacter halimunensis TaxID=3026934 RepID=A0ABQ6FNC8_9CHLR|nr:MFS transporter [Dictyobacter sp. S3.2.2.5]